MTKKQQFAIFFPATVILGTWAIVSNFHDQLYRRFPDLDRKIVRKAYRRFMLDAMRGKLPSPLDDYSDEEMDALFLERYNTLNEK